MRNLSSSTRISRVNEPSLAYRIIQEALTNTSRHAGQACAFVRLHYARDALTVQVDDDGNGAGAASPGPGLGLIGMRERVSALGGRLHAGPRPEGGYGVRAELPRSDENKNGNRA